MKKWQEPLYALGGFGTGFMYTVQMTYLNTIYRPDDSDIAGGIGRLIVPIVLMSVLMFIARAFDGLIDLPIATVTDNAYAKNGKGYRYIAFGLAPMILFYILLWLPPVKSEISALNVIWVVGFSILYFFFYTMTIVPYLSALSHIVPNQQSRVRVASWQAFFNTIGYSLAYTVIPLMRDALGGKTDIQKGMTMTALVLSPMMLTMVVPLIFIFFRKNKNDKPAEAKVSPVIRPEAESEKMSLWASFSLACKNKSFRSYLLVLVFFYGGLMLFLSGMDYMHRGLMGLSGWRITVMNMAAFAPIPLMLFLLNKLNKKKGIKVSLRVALVCFIIAMSLFTVAWTKLVGNTVPFYLGLAAGTFGSFSIGAFFTIPYAVPAQIAAEEAARTGVNRSGMYFGVQGLVNQIVAAICGSLIVLNLLNINTGFFANAGAFFIGPCVILFCLIAFIFAGKLDLDRPKADSSTESE